jgi:hypothetical protein
MPDLTLTLALNDRNLYPLLLAWSQKHHLDDQVKFLIDVRQNRPTDYLFANYLREGAPSEVNLAYSLMNQVRALETAPKNAENNKKLAKLLEDAYTEQVTFLSPTFATGGQAFNKFEPYLQSLGQSSADPKVTAALRALKLTGPKAKQFEGFMSVYLKARAVSDAYKAYGSMQKIVAKAKLDPELTKAGKPAATVERDYKVFKLAEALKIDVAEAKRYFETALAAVKSKGKPASSSELTRMFDSGRMRTEKVTKNYLVAIKADPAFATKYAVIAADKKKVDEQWAAYRKALGK